MNNTYIISLRVVTDLSNHLSSTVDMQELYRTSNPVLAIAAAQKMISLLEAYDRGLTHRKFYSEAQAPAPVAGELLEVPAARSYAESEPAPASAPAGSFRLTAIKRTGTSPEAAAAMASMKAEAAKL